MDDKKKYILNILKHKIKILSNLSIGNPSIIKTNTGRELIILTMDYGEESVKYNLLASAFESSSILMNLYDIEDLINITESKKWTIEDAPLTIGYKYLSEEYKRMIGKEGKL